MRCKHCFVDKTKDALNLDAIKEVIAKLVDEHGLFIVYYTYGEPLLSPMFEEVSSFCNKMNLVQVLMTNGSVIDEKILPIIRQNISTVYVSFDHSNAKIHDDNRGYNGAYSCAISSVSMLLEHDVSVGISMTVTHNNCNDIYNVYELAKKLKVNTLSLLRERKNGVLIELPSNNDYYLFLSEYFKRCSKETVCPNVMFHDPKILKVLNDNLKTHSISRKIYEQYIEMTQCHASCTLSLMPNGDVSQCNLSGDVIGNVLEDKLDMILKEKRIRYEHTFCCPAISWKSE